MAPALSIRLGLGAGLAVAPLRPARARPPGDAMASRWFTTSDDVRLHYLESTARAPHAAGAATLAFVPGWTMPASIWQPQYAHFAKRQTVVAIDPRGQGRSAVPPHGYDYARRAADVAEWLQHAAAGRDVVLVGWSLGVLECLQLMHDSRQTPAGAAAQVRVRGLVLVDNSVGVGEPPAGDPTFFSRLRAKREATVAAFVRGMFKRPQSPAFLAELTQTALRTPLPAAIDLLRQPRPREFWRDALYAAGVPVLYAYTPKFAQQGEIVKAHLQGGIETHLFAEAGHALFVDEPTRFNELLERFVARVAPVASMARPTPGGPAPQRPEPAASK